MRTSLILTLVLAASCTKGFSFNGTTTASAGSETSSGGGGGGGGGATSFTGGKPAAASATSSPEWWKKYDVRGVQLGQTRASLAQRGFTCGKRANSRCYKAADKRCDKAKCVVREDAFGQWWEADGVKTELDYITVATTETDSALVDDIRLQFGPRQPLDHDTQLGKALIAKYGEPTSVDEGTSSDKVGGGRMLWWPEKEGSNAPNIIVDCNGSNGEGPQCSLMCSDGAILDRERAKQQAIDDKRKRNAPQPAPEL
jgi:hypothetical protein